MVNMDKNDLEMLLNAQTKGISDLLATFNSNTMASIDKLREDMTTQFDTICNKINAVSTRLAAVEGDSRNNSEKLSNYEASLDSFQSRIATLEYKLQQQEINMAEQDSTIDQLHAQVDDQIDRGMRETAIIKGIQGQENSYN